MSNVTHGEVTNPLIYCHCPHVKLVNDQDVHVSGKQEEGPNVIVQNPSMDFSFNRWTKH